MRAAAARHGVVILADRDAGDLVAWWRARLGDGVAITPLWVDQELSDIDALERRLFRLGSPGVLVAALSSDALDRLALDHHGLLLRLFAHVRHRGAYAAQAVPAPGVTAASVFADFRRTLQDVRDQIEASGESPAELPRNVRKITISPELVALRKRGWHLLNVREEQVDELLPARESGVELSVIETRPAGSLPVQMQEFAYGPRHAEPWPDRLPHPAMEVRHYQGKFVSIGEMLVAGESTMLPESFRWPHREMLRHDNIRDACPHFTQLPLAKDAPVLKGDYYFLDCRFTGHFGHLLTEVVCRLWGWDAARRELPELKALFHTDERRGRVGKLERRLFTAYGIPESDIVATDRPVRLRSVVGASPMWHNAQPFYAHPGIQETWNRITAGLLDGASPTDHERIFVSRDESLDRRRCRNQQDVERFFAERGFHILYPERLPLEQQAAIFAGARVVAGFGGSAMFNMMHCQRLEATVVISHNAYQARNELLYTSILGGQLHYFWQESDLPLAEGVLMKHARRASYEFDFDRYGAELAKVLDEA